MPKNLLIPGKYGFTPDRYKTDMQTLEMWARQPIQQLIAGSGITLSPANGLATDKNGNGPNPITISASGGGGTAPAAFADIFAGPEGLTATNGQWWPFANVIGPQLNGFQQPIPLFQSPGTGEFETGASAPSFGDSWFTILVAGQSANILPFCETPPFTGGTGILYFQFYFWAVSVDFTNGAMYEALGPHGLGVEVPAFTSQQTTVADLTTTVITFGADLTLTAGAGDFGNGLVSGGVGTPYFAGVNGSVVIPAGTTF